VIKYKLIFSILLIVISILGCKTEVEKQENLLTGKEYKVWNSYKVGVNTHQTPRFCYVFYKDHSFEERYYNQKGEADLSYSDANVGIENSYKWKIVKDSILISSTLAKGYKESWFIKKVSDDTLTLVEKEGWIVKLIASPTKVILL
jgi:hypothetical protein